MPRFAQFNLAEIDQLLFPQSLGMDAVGAGTRREIDIAAIVGGIHRVFADVRALCQLNQLAGRALFGVDLRSSRAMRNEDQALHGIVRKPG